MMRHPYGRVLCSALFCAALSFSSSTAADNVPPSFSPPGGLPADSCPQFIVLGWDDNTYPDGMDWFLEAFKDRFNPEGSGNPETFDGLPFGMSFFMIGSAADNPEVLSRWEQIRDLGYEIGGHTMTHPDLGKAVGTLEGCMDQMSRGNAVLTEKLGIPADSILGFRTPYLSFNDASFEAVNKTGYLYECTMTQMQEYNAKLFTWPYTLDAGFPQKVIAGWEGKCVYPGMWEIPVYTVSSDATGTLWPPITGFDSSILTQGEGNKFGQMLKNALDFRIAAGGNRAPLTIGLHTDTYSAENADAATWYDKQLDLPSRKQALTDFVAYALTIPQVRFVSNKQLISWMRNPVPLGRPAPATASRAASAPASAALAIGGYSQGALSFSVPAAGRYTLDLLNVQGRRIASAENISCTAGANSAQLSPSHLTAGMYMVKISGLTLETCKKVIVDN